MNHHRNVAVEGGAAMTAEGCPRCNAAACRAILRGHGLADAVIALVPDEPHEARSTDRGAIIDCGCCKRRWALCFQDEDMERILLGLHRAIGAGLTYLTAEEREEIMVILEGTHNPIALYGVLLRASHYDDATLAKELLGAAQRGRATPGSEVGMS